MKRLLMILAVLALVGCGMFSADNGWRGYVAATEELANLAETYNTAYGVASPTARARWERDIDPLFMKAADSLRLWRSALDMSANPAAAQEIFLRMRGLILQALVEIKEG